MVQQITIQSQATRPLKPLVEIAIRKQLTSLRHGIARTREQLAGFEARFGISTAEMERRLQTGELPETLATGTRRPAPARRRIHRPERGAQEKS